MKTKKLVDKTKNRAFPSAILKDENGQEYVSMGMELRDWFAGQALVGHLSNNPMMAYPTHAVQTAYEYADEMMKQRESKR